MNLTSLTHEESESCFLFKQDNTLRFALIFNPALHRFLIDHLATISKLLHCNTPLKTYSCKLIPESDLEDHQEPQTTYEVLDFNDCGVIFIVVLENKSYNYFLAEELLSYLCEAGEFPENDEEYYKFEFAYD